MFFWYNKNEKIEEKKASSILDRVFTQIKIFHFSPLSTADDNDHDVDDHGGGVDGGSAEDYSTGTGTHPHFDRALRRSRRKSVSFSIVKVNKETMQFDIEQKSVLLEDLSSMNNQTTSGTSPKDKPPASPLFEVAKKWKDAKNKLVLKDKLFSHVPMLGTSGSSTSHSSGGDQFEFKDENFRSRRRELTEKAKALKDITTASNNQEVVVVGDKVAAVNDAVDVEDDAEAAAVVEAGAAAATAVVVVVKEDETAI